jgi:hypothetical protein
MPLMLATNESFHVSARDPYSADILNTYFIRPMRSDAAARLAKLASTTLF